jgi:hypothetical protein
MHRVDDTEWARYKGLALPEGAEGAQRAGPKPVAKEVTKQSWSDKIIISQDMQVRPELPELHEAQAQGGICHPN